MLRIIVLVLGSCILAGLSALVAVGLDMSQRVWVPGKGDRPMGQQGD